MAFVIRPKEIAAKCRGTEPDGGAIRGFPNITAFRLVDLLMLAERLTNLQNSLVLLIAMLNNPPPLEWQLIL